MFVVPLRSFAHVERILQLYPLWSGWTISGVAHTADDGHCAAPQPLATPESGSSQASQVVLPKACCGCGCRRRAVWLAVELDCDLIAAVELDRPAIGRNL